MKISAKQKQENRKAILASAVDLFIEQGIKGTSMRAVARNAGVGDATIYNYFPTKEALLYGYYLDAIQSAATSLSTVENYDEYDLRERVQLFFETLLDGFLGDREFVDQTFASVFFHPIPLDKGVKEISARFTAVISDMLQTAEEAGEIPDLVLRDLVCHFIWDYFIATVLYWLKDDSEQFANTTVFIDKCMDLGYTVLGSGVLDKTMSVASFLFKSHVLSRVDSIMEQRETLSRIKKEFMNHDY